MTMVCTLVFSIFTALAGDLSAKFLAHRQPEKLAAAEWHFNTETGADLIMFGSLDRHHDVHYEIRIPKMLSFLSGNSVDTKVIGLNDFPKDERPPLIIHYMFDLMVAIGVFLTAVSALYILLWAFKKKSGINGCCGRSWLPVRWRCWPSN